MTEFEKQVIYNQLTSISEECMNIQKWLATLSYKEEIIYNPSFLQIAINRSHQMKNLLKESIKMKALVGLTTELDHLALQVTKRSLKALENRLQNSLN